LNAPVPGFEWQITSRCNYHCSYCCQGQRGVGQGEDADDKLIDGVFRLIDGLSGVWKIKLTGGEPLLHPRFLELCRRISERGHQVSVNTNFSLPWRYFEELLELTGTNLDYVVASLHQEQVKQLDGFLEKAVRFNRRKRDETLFHVVTVCLEDSYKETKAIADRLESRGVAFALQPLKEHGRFVEYRSAEVRDFLRERVIDNADRCREFLSYGTMCHAGHLFFQIDLNGAVSRCYGGQPFSYLGNVKRGDCKLFRWAYPCLAQHCNCTVPANRGMIQYDKRVGRIEAKSRHYLWRLRRLTWRALHGRRASRPTPAG